MLDKGVSTTTEDPQMFGHPKGYFTYFLQNYGSVLVSME